MSNTGPYSYVVEVDETNKRNHGAQLRQRLESNQHTEPTAPEVSCEYLKTKSDAVKHLYTETNFSVDHSDDAQEVSYKGTSLKYSVKPRRSLPGERKLPVRYRN